MKTQNQKITFVGIGNRHRCDDGVGYEIVQKLKGEDIPNMEIIEASGEGATLMETLKDKSCVLMFDAVSSGAAAGTIFRFEAHHESIPTEFFNYSTHAFSLAEAIELARALNQLPEKVIVYGVEGKSFQVGLLLSSEVKNAIPEVIKKVLRDVAKVIKR